MESVTHLFETKPFSLNRQQYFQLITRAYYRKRWLLYVGFPVTIALVAIMRPMGDDYRVLIGIGLIALVAMCLPLIQFWFFSGKKSNEALYQEQHIQFGDDEMVAIMQAGQKRSMRYDGISKATKASDHYFISFRSNTFLYIPISAFWQKEDQEKFEELVSKGK